MKSVLAAAGLLAFAATGAVADPINRHTITGRSSAAAVAQGVPLDQTPKPPVEQQATVEGAAAGAQTSDGGQAAPARIVRYGLLGLSWRSQ